MNDREICPGGGIEKKPQVILTGGGEQETVRPTVLLADGLLKDQGFLECKRERTRDLAEHVSKLVQGKRWWEIVSSFQCLRSMALLEQDDLERQVRNVIKEAKSAGEFDTVVNLLNILISLQAKDDWKKKILEKEREKYKRIIDALNDLEQEITSALLTPEMRVIDSIIDGNFRKIPTIIEKTGMETARVLEILVYINGSLKVLNQRPKLFLPEVERKSKLGKYLTRFLLKRLISKGQLLVR